MREGEGQRRPAVDVLAEEAIGQHADLDGGARGVLDDRRPVFLREREDAEDFADAMRAVMRLDVPTDDPDLRAGRGRATQERERRERRACRAVVVVDAVMPPRRPHVLAQQAPGLRVEQPDMEIIPLHLERRPIQPGGAP